jgi:8-oxo-dGTP diphosphatase
MMMARPCFTYVRVVALIIKDGCILLEPPWENDHGSRQELWNAPGGALEPGESIEEALQREVLEEVGLDVEPVGIAYISQCPLSPEDATTRNEPVMSIEICCYAHPIDHGQQPRPEYEYEKTPQWVKFDEVARLPTLPFNLRGWAEEVSTHGLRHFAPITPGDYCDDLCLLTKPFQNNDRGSFLCS